MNLFKSKYYLKILFNIVFLLVLSSFFVSAEIPSLGSYNVSKPIIWVNYSENPVTIINYSIQSSLGFDYSSYFSQLPNDFGELNKVFNFTPQIILFNDDYFFDINAKDIDENRVSASANFNIDKPQMLIKLISPKFGIAKTKIFNVTILTGEKAICRYGRFPNAVLTYSTFSELYEYMPINFNQTNATLSNITDFNAGTETTDFQEWVVICKKSEILGDADENFAGLAILLGYDTTASTINVSAVPNPVFDWGSRKTTITVTTNDKAVCTINDSKINEYFGEENSSNFLSYTTSHSILIDYADSSIYGAGFLGPRSFPYNIKCTNLAQWNSASAYTVNYLINNSLQIERVSPEYVNNKVTNFTAETSITATCTISYKGINSSTGPGTNHTRSVTDLSEGRNTFEVSCYTSSGLEDAETFYVYLDTTAPTLTIEANENSCSLTALTFVMKVVDANGSGIKEYNYTVKNSTGTILREGKSTSSTISLSFTGSQKLKENETYTISGYAIDKAGNPSNEASVDIFATSNEGVQCDITAPILILNIVSALSDESNVFINVTCRDLGGSGCKEDFQYVLLPKNTDSCFGENATYEDESFSSIPLQFTEKGKLCVIVFDNNNNNASGSLIVTLTKLECGNGILEQQETTNHPAEQCDGTKLGYIDGDSAKCKNFDNFQGGILRCDENCHWDTSDCDVGYGYCGDSNINNFPNEQCDGTDWGEISKTKGCKEIGFSGGTLTCNPSGSVDQCTFNTSRCDGTSGSCGNGVLNINEQCENIVQRPLALNCTDFDSFLGGELSCVNCLYDIGQCVPPENITGPEEICGDNIIVPGEQCDGTNTGKIKTCENLGFTQGNLICNNNCIFSGCGSDEVITSLFGGDTFPCNNNIQDGDESDVDCGGSCDACLVGKACISDYDCYSRNCMNETCTEATCDDGKDDGKEDGIDCGGDCEIACETYDDEEPETSDNSSNSVGLYLLLIGVLILLGSAGYIIYNTYFNKNKNKSSGFRGSSSLFSSHHVESGKQSQIITSGSAQDKEKLQLQKEKMLKRQEERAKGRSSLLSGFDSAESAGNKEDELKKITLKETKGKSSSKESTVKSVEILPEEKKLPAKKSIAKKEESVFDKLDSIANSEKGKDLSSSEKQISKLKEPLSKKDSAFDKLDSIGKDISKSEVASKLASMSGQSEGKINSILKSDSLSQSETLNLFKGLSKKEITSDVFKEILSVLVTSGKIPKETISSVLFEFMDQEMLSKAEVAKLLKEMKLI